MVAHNIWDVEAQFKSDIFCQVKTLPAIYKENYVSLVRLQFWLQKQLNRQAGKAII